MDGDRARPQFAVVLRGYDRHQVDDYVARLLEDLGEAEQRARVAERSAGSDAGRLRQEAEQLLRRSRQHAEDQAEQVLAQARADAERIVASAREDARHARELRVDRADE